jgi:hypothetical protein
MHLWLLCFPLAQKVLFDQCFPSSPSPSAQKALLDPCRPSTQIPSAQKALWPQCSQKALSDQSLWMLVP